LPRRARQWDGGHGGSMAKKDPASKRPARAGPNLQRGSGWRWHMGLDDAGIDRILNKVGDVPGTLDKSELRKDILAAWDFYQGYKRDDSKGARTERREHATKIAHKTSELIHLLNDPAGDWVRSRIGRLLSLREWNEDEKITPLASLMRSPAVRRRNYQTSMHRHRILRGGVKCEAIFLVNRQRPCDCVQKAFYKTGGPPPKFIRTPG